MSELGIDVSELGIDVSELGTDVFELGIDVSELGTDVSELGIDVSELGTNVSELGIDVSELGTDVSEFGIDVSELGTDVSKLGTDVQISDTNGEVDRVVSNTRSFQLRSGFEVPGRYSFSPAARVPRNNPDTLRSSSSAGQLMYSPSPTTPTSKRSFAEA